MFTRESVKSLASSVLSNIFVNLNGLGEWCVKQRMSSMKVKSMLWSIHYLSQQLLTGRNLTGFSAIEMHLHNLLSRPMHLYGEVRTMRNRVLVPESQ
jgi:hypothetical protein